jgi:hypothetical protein
MVSELPGHEAVRGFFITYQEETTFFHLIAHSVARAPNGTLFDPTPLEDAYRRRFLLHLGSDAQFDLLKQQSQRWWPEDLLEAAFILSGPE